VETSHPKKRWSNKAIAVIAFGAIVAPVILYSALRIVVHNYVIDNSDGDSVTRLFPPLRDAISPKPAAANTVMPLFVKPFSGEYPVLNYFDHDRPVAPNDINGYQLTWQGARAQPGIDIGGYDG
jgi:hypothetical protein